jgi:hypothetical protein
VEIGQAATSAQSLAEPEAVAPLRKSTLRLYQRFSKDLDCVVLDVANNLGVGFIEFLV